MYLCDGKIGNNYKVSDIELPTNMEKRLDPWDFRCRSEQQKPRCSDRQGERNTVCSWAQYHQKYFSGVNSDERKLDNRLHRKSELRKDYAF